jgi:hypothetical protein
MTNKTAIWLLVAAGLFLVIGANTHLVYVAVTSQPECVAHLRPGEGDGQSRSFSAAQSACSPQREILGAKHPE